MKRRIWFCLLASSWAWGGWHQNPAEMEKALEWGASDRFPSRSSVAVVQKYEGVELVGSGTIVAPNWVATAAHVSDNNITQRYAPCVTAAPHIFDEEVHDSLLRAMGGAEQRPDSRSITQIVSFGAGDKAPDVAFLRVSDPFPDAWVAPIMDPQSFKGLCNALRGGASKQGVFGGYGYGVDLKEWRAAYPSGDDYKKAHTLEGTPMLKKLFEAKKAHFGQRSLNPCTLTSCYFMGETHVKRSQLNGEGGQSSDPASSALMFDSGGGLFIPQGDRYEIVGVVGRSMGHEIGRSMVSMTSFMPLYTTPQSERPVSMMDRVLKVQSDQFEVRLVASAVS